MNPRRAASLVRSFNVAVSDRAVTSSPAAATAAAAASTVLPADPARRPRSPHQCMQTTPFSAFHPYFHSHTHSNNRRLTGSKTFLYWHPHRAPPPPPPPGPSTLVAFASSPSAARFPLVSSRLTWMICHTAPASASTAAPTSPTDIAAKALLRDHDHDRERARNARRAHASSFTGVTGASAIGLGLGVNLLHQRPASDTVFMEFDSSLIDDMSSENDVESSTSTITTSSSDASSPLAESSTLSKDDSDELKTSAPDSHLTFRSGVVCIPHPEKADKGGEDAYFIQRNALGVFDGVGGWASIGVDAGLYSKELARLTANFVCNEGPASVVEALKNATDNNRAVGSSTACVIGLDGTQLVGVNVGDSGLIVIRDGAIVYRTTEQQHYFNCPYQIGTDSLDTVEVGGPIDVRLQHGDWIIMGTDGLWDNVFPSSVVEIVSSHDAQSRIASPKDEAEKSNQNIGDATSEGSSILSDCSVTQMGAEDAQRIAHELGEFAVKVANDERSSSPFAVNAQNAGHLFLGGKVDDITIISALVVDPNLSNSTSTKEQESGRIDASTNAD